MSHKTQVLVRCTQARSTPPPPHPSLRGTKCLFGLQRHGTKCHTIGALTPMTSPYRALGAPPSAIFMATGMTLPAPMVSPNLLHRTGFSLRPCRVKWCFYNCISYCVDVRFRHVAVANADRLDRITHSTIAWHADRSLYVNNIAERKKSKNIQNVKKRREIKKKTFKT